MSVSPIDTASAPQGQHQFYKGSCCCGFITYSVCLNLTTPNPKTGAITKCNSTFRLKGGGTLVMPEEGSFKLLTPTEGMDTLTDYTFNTNRIHYRLP